MIIVNFKAYKEACGKNAVKLAKICEEVSKKSKVQISVAVQAADIESVARSVSVPVLAQHVDAIEAGPYTGWTLPESVRDAGAVGSLLNHSELKLPPAMLMRAVKRLKKLGMISIVCADNPVEEQSIVSAAPDMLAIEPPELIGGKVSVSKARPELISESVRRAGDIPVFVGAGVHTSEDVRTALKLGAKGVLVASGVVLAKDQKKALLELVKGFEK